MKTAVRRACAGCASAMVAALAGCAAPADTRVMGAAPACDLRVELRQGGWCALHRVSPPDATAQLTQRMDDFEDRTGAP